MRSEKNRDATEQTIGRGVVGRLRSTFWITGGWFSRAQYKLLLSLSSGVPWLLLHNLLLGTQVALMGSLRNTSREATVRCHRASLGQREGWKRGSVVQLDNSLGQRVLSPLFFLLGYLSLLPVHIQDMYKWAYLGVEKYLQVHTLGFPNPSVSFHVGSHRAAYFLLLRPSSLPTLQSCTQDESYLHHQ